MEALGADAAAAAASSTTRPSAPQRLSARSRSPRRSPTASHARAPLAVAEQGRSRSPRRCCEVSLGAVGAPAAQPTSPPQRRDSRAAGAGRREATPRRLRSKTATVDACQAGSLGERLPSVPASVHTQMQRMANAGAIPVTTANQRARNGPQGVVKSDLDVVFLGCARQPFISGLLHL